MDVIGVDVIQHDDRYYKAWLLSEKCKTEPTIYIVAIEIARFTHQEPKPEK